MLCYIVAYTIQGFQPYCLPCYCSYDSQQVEDNHKLRGEKLNKRIIQKDLKGNILAKYDSVTQAAIATNARASNISKCANHKYGFKTANGCIWEWDSSRYPVISLVPNESISNVKKIAEAKKPVTMAEIQQIEK